MNHKFPFIKYQPQVFSEEEMLKRSKAYFHLMDKRRSVRNFSNKAVSIEIMENLIKTASTAPSGAHKQPWTFCLVGNPEIKRQIRIEAEKEERESYENRMSESWLRDLEPIGTDWQKPFLEIAPWLVVVFRRNYDLVEGQQHKNYYVNESVGLACGFFIGAVHHAGLCTLTHTPSPMNFLSKILNRPENEKPFLLLPVGYAAQDVEVPDLKRKDLNEVIKVY